MIRVVSLFSGGGFAEYALQLASEQTGIDSEIVMAVDSWEPAARVRDANFGGVRTTVRSVKEMTRADLPPHDLVIGGPPCQPWSLAGKRGGADDPRDCIPDFIRLRGSNWLMENVTSRLLERMGGGWSEKFCAADFGDVTSRKRWFYSSHLLHVVQTPGPRRFGDIRDHDADAKAIDKRGRYDPRRFGAKFGIGDGEIPGSVCGNTHLGGGGTLVEIRPGAGARVTSHTHDQPLRAGQAKPTQDDDVLGSLTAGKGCSTGFLKVGLRGHSASASASAFEDDEVLGSLVSNSWHGNELGKLGPSVRCPSLLEMARAHSIPDSWDWAGVTKTQRGQIIANGWPIGMGAAICAAMLRALDAESRLGASA